MYKTEIEGFSQKVDEEIIGWNICNEISIYEFKGEGQTYESSLLFWWQLNVEEMLFKIWISSFFFCQVVCLVARAHII